MRKEPTSVSSPEELLGLLRSRRKDVVILRGASGSGKTHLAEALSALTPSTYVCFDQFRTDKDGEYVYRAEDFKKVHDAGYQAFKKALRDKKTLLIMEGAFASVTRLATYREVAIRGGRKPAIVTVVFDPKKAAQRNRHGVKESAVLRTYESITNKPLPREWDEVLYLSAEKEDQDPKETDPE